MSASVTCANVQGRHGSPINALQGCKSAMRAVLNLFKIPDSVYIDVQLGFQEKEKK